MAGVKLVSELGRYLIVDLGMTPNTVVEHLTDGFLVAQILPDHVPDRAIEKYPAPRGRE